MKTFWRICNFFQSLSVDRGLHIFFIANALKAPLLFLFVLFFNFLFTGAREFIAEAHGCHNNNCSSYSNESQHRSHQPNLNCMYILDPQCPCKTDIKWLGGHILNRNFIEPNAVWHGSVQGCYTNTKINSKAGIRGIKVNVKDIKPKPQSEMSRPRPQFSITSQV